MTQNILSFQRSENPGSKRTALFHAATNISVASIKGSKF